MSHTFGSPSAATSAAALLFASLVLAACGSSSKSPSPSSSASSTSNAVTAGTTSPPPAPNASAGTTSRAPAPNASAGTQSRKPSSEPAVNPVLAQFAACMRQNGINLPAPKTGKGPVFSAKATKGINTRSPQFKAAFAKCRTTLSSVLGLGRPGAAGSGAATGAAPGGKK
jgi:hypothetical protein